MPPRPPSLVLACLLAACATAPAGARPGTGTATPLRIGVRIIADCHGAGARDTACRPARQRSDDTRPVPAQVAALSPAVDGTDRPVPVTVTY
ncbi:hypothetical protein [Stenotrophomonas sp.]|jgi:hypothetical protein|uniref:hypothetical protein n=1 Tax=Stenotrophomonas sp. TaxID=69392 RepID=UPI0029B6AE03|nr:hypothetical protein [Stenotrophomonas sp.]MDX3935082.1 hypothetical protein [Stenotrophomonas sp.]